MSGENAADLKNPLIQGGWGCNNKKIVQKCLATFSQKGR